MLLNELYRKITNVFLFHSYVRSDSFLLRLGRLTNASCFRENMKRKPYSGFLTSRWSQPQNFSIQFGRISDNRCIDDPQIFAMISSILTIANQLTSN